MTIYTIGFTKKSAERFFTLLKEHDVRVVADIRLNPASQLAGFSKGSDLGYFLREILDCDYRYEEIFAPVKELMDGVRAKTLSPAEFEAGYRALMDSRTALDYFDEHYAEPENVCLLCSEETPDICHRRVLAEMIAARHPGTEIRHL